MTIPLIHDFSQIWIFFFFFLKSFNCQITPIFYLLNFFTNFLTPFGQHCWTWTFSSFFPNPHSHSCVCEFLIVKVSTCTCGMLYLERMIRMLYVWSDTHILYHIMLINCMSLHKTHVSTVVYALYL